MISVIRDGDSTRSACDRRFLRRDLEPDAIPVDPVLERGDAGVDAVIVRGAADAPTDDPDLTSIHQ